MKQFVYPAVYYADSENNTSTLLLPDVDILATDDTVENAFVRAKSHLLSFIDWSIKFGGAIADPTSFKETMVLNPRKDILLIDVESNAQKIDRNALDRATTNLINSLFED